MPEINLGVDYTDVEDMDKFPTVPNGTYDFTIAACEEVQCGPNSKTPGRPMLKWTLKVVNPEDGNEVNIFYNSVLPWEKDGELDTSGLGLLVAICKAVNMPWTGGGLVTEDYIGQGGSAVVELKPGRSEIDGVWQDDPDKDPQNNIKKFIY